MSPYVRTVKTSSGARAVQIVHSSRRGSRDIEHIGSAHDEAELAVLKSVARQRLAAGQGELDLGLDDSPEAGGPLEITGSRWDTCEMRCVAGSTVSGSPRRPVVTRCSGSRWIEQRTGWSIKKFVRTARRYRTVTIRVGDHTLTAADPCPVDPSTLALRHNFANVYREMGRRDESVNLFEQALEESLQTLGPAHRNTFIARNSLAYAYREVGRTDEAVDLFERALDDSRRVLGPDDPFTLILRHNLAYTYYTMRQIDHAIEMYDRTTADFARVRGPDHPDTLTALIDLADAYQAVRQLNQAIELYIRTTAGLERVLGPDHPDVLRSRNNLARAYRAAGRVDDANALNPDHRLES